MSAWCSRVSGATGLRVSQGSAAPDNYALASSGTKEDDWNSAYIEDFRTVVMGSQHKCIPTYAASSPVLCLKAT